MRPCQPLKDQTADVRRATHTAGAANLVGTLWAEVAEEKACTFCNTRKDG